VPRSPLIEPLDRLADTWYAATRSSRRRAAIALVALAWVAAVLVARHGTTWARAGAFAIVVASAVGAAAWRLSARRRLREPEHVLRALAARVDRERALRALRALSLLDTDGGVRAGGTSPELAELHVSRALADVPRDRIVARASRIAARASSAALLGGVCVVGVALANAWSVLEGADVLFARGGVAPVAMRWLDGVELTARPPEYLRQEEIHEFMPGALVLPAGTLITLRGVPAHPGRLLRLSDGTMDVPFVEDGSGAVVARWSLVRDAALSVVVRFGDVVVKEPSGFDIRAVPDLSPVVTLEGAPRHLLLVDQSQDIPLRYVATDDHGLREVHLVLRSGVREERRVVARLDGQLRSEGGQVLRLGDPFVKRSHVPVEVTVEAKDNDPLTGPKWGASAAIVIVPPEVGEPEARRLDALRGLRDALVDALAWRLRNDVPAAPAAKKAFAVSEKIQVDAIERNFVDALSATYGGLRVPSRSRTMLVAQEQKARSAVNAEIRAPSAASHASAVKATERFLLVADAVVRGLGIRDSRDSAKRLADVAEDLASGAVEMQNEAADARSRGATRMDAATAVLSGGATMMMRLGALGRDIGEIVQAYLPRVKRARDAQDLPHAELAARDLAARLSVPDPSFGSSSVRRGGGESGGARGTPGDDDEESPDDDVEQAFKEAAQDLERLAQDHAGEIGKMEQALAGATSHEEIDRMREEARRHAEAIREAARDLPAVGAGSDSWTSKGAAARELAEQMAHALEDGRVDEAAESGRTAAGALDEGKKMLEKGRWLEDPTGEQVKRLDDAHRKIQAEEKWAEAQLELLRRHAAERASKQLEAGGDEEGKLGDRARDLADRGRDRGSLPQKAIESIDDADRAAHAAAEALRRGDADKGLERQHEAQRDLEEAAGDLRDDDDPGNDMEGDREGVPSGGNVEIPKGEDHKGPEDFRRRVVKGLAQPGTTGLKEAVRRYAEGLLR
jgi:hypothetical protein